MKSERTDVSKVRQLWPLLFVSDIERSTSFYRDQLGFALVGQAGDSGRPYWCRFERGGACIMLQQDDGSALEHGPPGSVVFYFVCEDADAMYRELDEVGLVVDAPTTAPYGMRQLFVPEPDGYAICFESPTAGWRG